ncbi:6-phosphogluconolactonase [Peribacillus sp. SCS-155]|uniref:6-phosphogluconolactonase n=1 Tax=Peribacillus sedimenti TaxID=3115297 RepID=UPI0039069BDA
MDETTQTVGQKYFSTTMSLEKGITLGIKTILQAKQVILMADGKKKADIIEKTVKGPVTNKVPSSVLKEHRNAELMVDAEAASKL